FQALALDVLPYVEVGPVPDRAGADVLALVRAGVEQIPQFRPLVLRVPLTELVAEALEARLVARVFRVAARTTDARIEADFLDGFVQRLRLVLVARLGRALQDLLAVRDRLLHRAHAQALAQFGGAAVAEFDHFRIVVAGGDVHQRGR